VNLQNRVSGVFDELFAAGLPERVGVAVSGGGDSVALLQLAVSWARDRDVQIFAATVDHGLRPGAREEAVQVGEMCMAIGVQHEILEWRGWDKSGNLQDAARKARISLLGNWAKTHQISDVATGHTQDDQAETVLIRLGRGSGVDGLSGIPATRMDANVRWIRPLLETGREELRQLLRTEGINWIEDPSNDDRRFERVKARQAMTVLEDLGITRKGLSETAGRMTKVRHVLDENTQIAAKNLAKTEFGDVFLSFKEFFNLAEETRRRLLIHALNWVSGAEYPPRSVPLAELETSVLIGKTSTLHGCMIMVRDGVIIITREYKSVSASICKTTEIWDNRWLFSGPHVPGYTVQALGETGLKLCPDWRDTGMLRTSLLASPSVWNEKELVAAPLAGYGTGWSVEMLQSANHFYSTIISH